MATIALRVELITPNIEEGPLTLRQMIKLRAPVPEGSGRDGQREEAVICAPVVISPRRYERHYCQAIRQARASFLLQGPPRWQHQGQKQWEQSGRGTAECDHGYACPSPGEAPQLRRLQGPEQRQQCDEQQ